ncbi:MAG TPA: type 2 lanthipeptide synthetase LanM, partial [Thermoanaerobaculia bacterium]
GHNRPRLEGEEIDLLDYADDLVAGFQDTYRLLARHRDGLLILLDRFAGDEVRSVVPPTQTYGLLLTDSFHPDFQRDALQRDRHFDRLWVPIESRPYLARVIPFEKVDLWRGDVPIFTFHPGARDLLASDGTRIPDFFDQTGLDLVRERVRQLGEEDRERQLWFLRASLAVLTVDLDTARWPSYEVAPPRRPASRDRLLEQATRIGDHLAGLAIRGGGEVTWIGLVTEMDRFPALIPLKLDLYSGAPGLALFLAHLGAATGETRFTRTAREALQGVRRVLRKDPSLVSCLGAFGGWGGLLYTWAQLAVLWDEPALLREAEGMVGLFASQIAADPYLDLLAGSAGCAAGLLALHALRPSDRLLDAAAACGERLLATAVRQEDGSLGWLQPSGGNRPWAGLSHGCAGIALALLRLAAATGDGRFHAAALDAMAYERGLFDPEVGNWRDARDLDEVRVAVRVGEEVYMTAWCHGSTGIGQARLAGLDLQDDAEVRAEIEAALVDTLRNGFGQNHSLCHGDLGNLDLLLEAARRLDAARWQPEVDRLTASILDSMDDRGWLCGVALGVETPGLMTGLAGIGLGLLRLADPDRVPDLLTVEPPGQAAPQGFRR